MSATHGTTAAIVRVYAPPLAALVLFGLEHAHVVDAETPWVAILSGLLLLGSVFAAVHHAEVVALKVGEPFGSVLLALAVTVIEASLIVTSMLSGGATENALARDSVFAAVVIVLTGVVGLCLLVGGARYREQGFRVEGTGSALSVLATLAVLTLVMPNYTLAKFGPQYSPTQLVFVSVLSLLLYFVFVFVQSVRHRDYFLPEGASDIGEESEPPSASATGVSAVMLVVSLLAVVLLAETLAESIERAIHAAHLPPSFLGVVIAALVLLPESVAAVKAARSNHLQTSLNLAIGSALACIGLTIPVVAGVSLYLGRELTLGLDAEGTAILLLTLFVSSLTLATGRATILQGAVHLVIFGVFLLLAAVP
ncbi:Ca2+:H+ antiporter [Roseiarcus fermentans]|uniref:Ca2+:H+ antiporter n=1 Tax=Roseiarcus fermentans TaxID=1473586 RepID=A0A366F7F6_9HYPH|nr:ionic transporter y4hA [Roseiarcus fermentans]RBP10591.1 Ca2+:H+ antiporter [Roseiarcus fermentans]